jgi:hypothetical protein
MASVKNLKKDIDYLVFEVISDCFTFSELNPDVKTDELAALISETVDFRNDMISRVNNPDGKDNPKIVKAYYKKLEKDLFAGVDQFFTRLSELSPAKA